MLIVGLRKIVGKQHVLISSLAKKGYVSGYRFGQGDAIAVVRPGNLLELWETANLCIRSGAVIIMQAANTGLTGGSTPHGKYDREVVVIETMRLRRIHVLGNAEQVICLPGTTLYDLERTLGPYGRDPHSEIGSSCLGASVTGGICNNSGGALVRRGPAYTEAALFGRVNAAGHFELVNELGIELGNNPEEILQRLECGDFDVEGPPERELICSARNYVDQVSEIDQPTPARFNANPEYLHYTSGSAGRLVVLALRLDTFPKPVETQVIHVATNSADTLSGLRRHMLAGQACVPISGEYIGREMFALSERFGKDTFLAVRFLGTHRLPLLFRIRRRLDDFAGRIAPGIRHAGDHVLQWLSRLAPRHLGKDLRSAGATYAHHLLLKVDADQVTFVQAYLASVATTQDIHVRVCSAEQGRDLFLHRFAAAGAAMRYAALNEGRLGELVALDVALPRNATDWHELVPEELQEQVAGAFLYGHFFCHVFHLDIVLKRGVDADAFKQAMLASFEAQGAECPAEHNVGHLYEAKPALREFYRQLDPMNVLNPGIGMTSRKSGWQ